MFISVQVTSSFQVLLRGFSRQRKLITIMPDILCVVFTKLVVFPQADGE